MLGVKSHVVPLVDEIKKVGGEGANFAVTTFIQGSGGGGTRRWGVAWSWTGWRPGWGIGVCGVKGKGIGGKVKPFKGVCEILVPVGKERGVDKVKRSVIGIIEDLAKSAGRKELKWGITEGKNNETLLNGWVSGDLWSRAARRRRARGTATVDSAQHDHEQPQEEETQGRDVDENSLKGMWFRITIGLPAPTTTTQNEEAEGDEDEDEEMTPVPEQQLYDYAPQSQPHTHASSVQVQQRGSGAETATLITIRLTRCNPSDTMLFESFCGMLRRKILCEPASTC